MVPADRADDDEHWSLDTRRGMDRGRDGKIYQGAQSIVGLPCDVYNRSSSVVPFCLPSRPFPPLCITRYVNPFLFCLNVDQVQTRSRETEL